MAPRLSRARPDAELTAAYDAVRAERGVDALFSRTPLTVEEAVFSARRPSGEERSGYAPGDEFDCPVCDGTHAVELHEDEYAADAGGIDASYLYAECPDARGDRLTIELQAKTGPEV